ncbi:DUF5718 family protein [Sulfurimonas paralvinellae]|uniref:Valyl-tRNA synthetase n=1 Tax=Sulfurimonas paralvinellae TaxID=317658 RepID=A0A7M1B685_9BACT|nr:DUF5718 family protein [Sulfurimonas paralvinellae]QOP45211.1 hypothetical protein FM071_02475 [Sulfurimonas paralvinellae]
MSDYKEYLGLGIAGNFALHLAQAGELEEFKDVITADEAAPKGIFPFYLPCKKSSQSERPREMLFTYPLSSETLQLPNENLNVQAEPEVALICELTYIKEKLVHIAPQAFGAYNDASIRVAGAQKISDKKNWGANTKGIATELLPLDIFEDGGMMDNYSICSFLRRDDALYAYGENVELTGYSYFYEKLTDWILNQINTQEDFGPLEDIKSYIKECNNPTKLIISIGATRYTDYGEKTFLQSGDEVLIAVYNHNRYSLENIEALLQNKQYEEPALSILAQKVL